MKASTSKPRATVLIGGDVCPIGRNAQLMQDGDVAAVFGFLLDEFRSADYTVVNLECPLIDGSTPPIVKSGPTLSAHPSVAKALRRAEISAVNLANNHIMDHGEEGLRQTIQACKNAQLSFFGVGRNAAEANTAHAVSLDGLRIAIVGVAEHEFSVAGIESCGANPLDLIDFARAATDWRDKYDHLIVLFHGGTELYPYPSPQLQKTCRFLVELGASAVVCQHSHCPGCYESYHGAPIVYGQGNLLFDFDASNCPEWHQGFLVKLLLGDVKRPVEMEIVPFLQSLDSAGVRRMGANHESEFRKELDGRCAILADERQVHEKWKAHCMRRRASYLSHILGHGKVRRRLNRKFGISERLLSPETVARLLNVVRCESHRDVLHQILESLYCEKSEQIP